MQSDKLNAQEKRNLKDSNFGIPSKREFPLPDAAHVRAAEAYFRYAANSDKPELARKILLKAREFGLNVQSPTVLEWADK